MTPRLDPAAAPRPGSSGVLPEEALRWPAQRDIAAAMVHGPRVGLAMVARLDADPRMARNHRLDAVRAHLLEMAGDDGGAVEAYRRAARRTTSAPERRYLDHRAELLQER